MTTNILGSSVVANSRTRAGRVKYILGKVMPSVFGAPIHVSMKLTSADGKVRKFNHYNAVTTAGRNGIADQILASPTLGKPTHIAVGTGTGGTTTLATELDRNPLTSKTRSGAVVTMVGNWAAGDATGALTEAGILTAASGGDLWLYTTFPVVNKQSADALEITWTLTIS